MLALAAVGMGLFAPPSVAAQETDAPAGLRIDRWLVSNPIALDSIDDSGEASLLSGSGEFGVLPRRGEERAGARWTLIRNDGAAPFRLDSLISYVVEPAAAGTFMAARDSVDAPGRRVRSEPGRSRGW
jgi:hypothetical protein